MLKSAASTELFPGLRHQDAVSGLERLLLAACLSVGRAANGRGGPMFAMVELLRQCRKYADLVDGVRQ